MLQNHCFELLDGKRPGNLDTLDLHNNCVFQLFHHKLCKFLDQAPIFQFLDYHYWKKKDFYIAHKKNNLLFICLSGQNSAHIPEEFSVHLLFGSENFKNPQNLSALFCYKVDILKLQGRDWSAIQLCIKYPLHKQSENP